MPYTMYFDPDNFGRLRGGDRGRLDGSEHAVSLLEHDRHMVLRVALFGDSAPIEFIFSDEQAIAFTGACESIMLRLRLEERPAE